MCVMACCAGSASRLLASHLLHIALPFSLTQYPVSCICSSSCTVLLFACLALTHEVHVPSYFVCVLSLADRWLQYVITVLFTYLYYNIYFAPVLFYVGHALPTCCCFSFLSHCVNSLPISPFFFTCVVTALILL